MLNRSVRQEANKIKFMRESLTVRVPTTSRFAFIIAAVYFPAVHNYRNTIGRATLSIARVVLTESEWVRPKSPHWELPSTGAT